MAKFPAFTPSQVVSDVEMTQLAVDFVHKTANESVTSSTTLQDDDHLRYTVAAAGTYAFDVWLYAASAANAAGDIKIGWTFPAGTLHFSGVGLDTSLTSGFTGTVHTQAALSATSGSTFLTLGLSTNNLTLHVHGILIATATGTLQLQWAQQSANASASTVKAGSHMLVRQVA